MRDFFIAMSFIPLLLAGWLFVQRISRLFVLKHPEWGPPREESGGCGSHCGCSGKGRCSNS